MAVEPFWYHFWTFNNFELFDDFNCWNHCLPFFLNKKEIFCGICSFFVFYIFPNFLTCGLEVPKLFLPKMSSFRRKSRKKRQTIGKYIKKKNKNTTNPAQNFFFYFNWSKKTTNPVGKKRCPRGGGGWNRQSSLFFYHFFWKNHQVSEDRRRLFYQEISEPFSAKKIALKFVKFEKT